MDKDTADFTLEWIKAELRNGKFLVMPESLYEKVIPKLKEKGWTGDELIEEIKNNYVQF